MSISSGAAGGAGASSSPPRAVFDRELAHFGFDSIDRAKEAVTAFLSSRSHGVLDLGEGRHLKIESGRVVADFTDTKQLSVLFKKVIASTSSSSLTEGKDLLLKTLDLYDDLSLDTKELAQDGTLSVTVSGTNSSEGASSASVEEVVEIPLGLLVHSPVLRSFIRGIPGSRPLDRIVLPEGVSIKDFRGYITLSSNPSQIDSFPTEDLIAILNVADYFGDSNYIEQGMAAIVKNRSTEEVLDALSFCLDRGFSSPTEKVISKTVNDLINKSLGSPKEIVSLVAALIRLDPGGWFEAGHLELNLKGDLVTNEMLQALSPLCFQKLVLTQTRVSIIPPAIAAKLDSLELVQQPGIASLELLPMLKELKVMGCADLADLRGLDGSQHLESLSIDNAPVAALPQGCLKLSSVALKNCQNIADLDALNGSKSLRCLKLDNLRALDRVPSGLLELDILHLRTCLLITSLKPLTDSINLREMIVEDLPDLRELPDKCVGLKKCEIRSCNSLWKLAPLRESIVLTHLVLENLPLVSEIPLGLTSLTRCEISDCPGIVSLESLSKSASLNCLILSRLASLRDVPSGLTRLQTLQITRCHMLSSLKTLSGSMMLREIVLKELAALRELPDNCVGLKICEIHDCNCLSSIDGLKESIALSHLLLYNLPELAEIPSGLIGLEFLEICSSGKITTLDPLSGSAYLKQIGIAGLGSLTQMPSRLTGLETCSISSCQQLTTIEPLSGSTSLIKLTLSHMDALRSMPAGCSALQECVIMHCSHLSSLDPLSGSIVLSTLKLYFLERLRVLPSGCRGLQIFTMHGCPAVDSLSVLGICSSLREVDITRSSAIKDISCFRGMKNTRIIIETEGLTDPIQRMMMGLYKHDFSPYLFNFSIFMQKEFEKLDVRVQERLCRGFWFFSGMPEGMVTGLQLLKTNPLPDSVKIALRAYFDHGDKMVSALDEHALKSLPGLLAGLEGDGAGKRRAFENMSSEAQDLLLRAMVVLDGAGAADASLLSRARVIIESDPNNPLLIRAAEKVAAAL